jgi:hypothetical protein
MTKSLKKSRSKNRTNTIFKRLKMHLSQNFNVSKFIITNIKINEKYKTHMTCFPSQLF